MTDTDVATNGAGPAPTSAKRKIANTTIEGSTATIKFSPEFGSSVVHLDTSRLPKDMQGLLAAQGAGTVVQNAYSSTKGDPVQAAQEAMDAITSGTWRPGPPRGEVLVDALLQATADHLTEESGKPFTVEQVEQEFLPKYQARHGLATPGAARRRLRTHPDISQRIVEIEADRAKRAKDKVKGVPRESLLDV